MPDQPKVNPYNFVPLEIPPRHSAYPGIDRLSRERYSGVLVCELKAVKPLFTADHRIAEKPKEKAESDESKRRKAFRFLRDSHTPKNRPIIQGTSLRGMVRSIYEASTNSCLPLAAVSGVSLKSGHKVDFSFDGLGEHQACTSSTELCPACRLFGIIQGEELHVQGRVAFSDAVLSKGELRERRIALAELSSPKPHHSGIYGVHGRSGRPIAGRKLYYHHEPGLNEPPNRSVRANDITEYAPPGTVFRFTMSFRNLSLEELAEIRHCLVLDEGLAHKIGMAKPLGFGSCRISLIDDECSVYEGGRRYESWRASALKISDLTLVADPFPASLREILRIAKHEDQVVGYLGWKDYQTARIDQNGMYIRGHVGSSSRGQQEGSGFKPISAAFSQLSDKKSGSARSKIRVGQKIKVEVTADDDGEYVLRVKETGQEGVRLRPGTRWEVGETQRVRVVALDDEGRVAKVKT